jgi:hypothetical protein
MHPQSARLVAAFVLVAGLACPSLVHAGGKPAGPNPAHIQHMIQQARQQQQQMMQQIQQMMQQRAQMMAQQQQQMMRQAQVAQRAASVQARRTAQVARRAMRNMPRPVLQNVVAEYDFVVADEALVRTMHILNPELDDKGEIKKLSAEEKLKLKGDTPEEQKLTGYKAAVEDIQPGDEVIVSLSKYQPAKSSKKDEDTETKEKKSGDKESAKDSSDEMTDHDKIAKLANWKRQGKLHGVVLEVDATSSRRMTIAIQGQQIAMVKPGQKNNNANNQNAKPKKIDIDPSVLQATFVVIVKRGQNGAGLGVVQK